MAASIEKPGIYRSEDMNLYKVVMSKDNEYKVAALLGKNSSSHFIDMNEQESSMHLAYITQVKRCEESDKKLNSVLK
jgi:hypothetical protein